jgi:hypothetical protein
VSQVASISTDTPAKNIQPCHGFKRRAKHSAQTPVLYSTMAKVNRSTATIIKPGMFLQLFMDWLYGGQEVPQIAEYRKVN